MSVLYADSSALARAYLADEPEHAALRELLLEGDEAVVTSELAAVELSAAFGAAARAGRVRDLRKLVRRIDADLSGDPVALLALRPEEVFPAARRLVHAHPLYAADAIHLAVALVDAPELAADRTVVLVTSDRRQAEAARAEGLPVWR